MPRSIHDKIKDIQKHADNGVAPEEIDVRPTLDRGPAVLVKVGRRTHVFPLSEGVEVTDDPDALEKPGSLLIGVNVESPGLARRPEVATRADRIKLIHGFNPKADDRPADAIYSSISEGYVNETTHNHRHLVQDHDHATDYRFYLFEP